ncbi:MAG: hypothetical protein GY701_27350, partial [Sulfitobacter sp.]|nr:hypothetical protein [Sulfitobacter sp.]
MGRWNRMSLVWPLLWITLAGLVMAGIFSERVALFTARLMLAPLGIIVVSPLLLVVTEPSAANAFLCFLALLVPTALLAGQYAATMPVRPTTDAPKRPRALAALSDELVERGFVLLARGRLPGARPVIVFARPAANSALVNAGVVS